MVRTYAKSASKDVKEAMEKRKAGKLKRGPGGRGGPVKSDKQAIAIGLSEARAKRKNVPAKKTTTARKKSPAKKKAVKSVRNNGPE